MTAPLKLRRLHQKLGTFRAVADIQRVNIFWVIQVLRDTGREPNSPDIRARLFLPKTRRKKNSQAAPTPAHLNWWRHLPKEERRKIMLMAYLKQGE